MERNLKTRAVQGTSPTVSRASASHASTSYSLGYTALAMGAFIVIVYWSTAMQLVDVWLNQSIYSHGLLVVAVSLYIILMERNTKMFFHGVRLQWVAVVLALSVGWFAADVVSVQTAQQFFIVALWAASVLAISGFRGGRKVVAAVLFVCFAVPVWDVLISILQSITVFVVTRFVSLAGINVVIDGNLIAVSSGQLQIARGCSGLGYFLVSVVLASVGSFFYLTSLASRIGLVMAAVFSSLVANWVRVFIIVLVAHFSGIDNQIVQDHEILGWIVFFVILLPVFGLYLKKFAKDQGSANAANTDAETDSSGANAAVTSKFNLKFVMAYAVVLISVAIGPALALVATSASPGSEGSPRLSIMSADQNRFDWKGPYRPAVPWQPAFLGAADEVAVSYVNDGGVAVDARVVLYGKQTHGSELVSYDNSVVDDMSWRLLSSARQERPSPVHSYTEQIFQVSSQSKFIVRFWYQVGTWRGVSQLVAKVQQLRQIIKGTGPQAMVAIGALCESDCMAERAMLDNLLADRELLVRPVVDQQPAGNSSYRYVL